MTHRRHGAAAYNAVKTATKLLVEALGGVEAAASCTRVGKSQFSDYGNLAAPDRFVPADVVLDAEAIAGRPLVTAALANAQGYALVRINPRDGGDLAQKLIEISRDSAVLFTHAAAALIDGRLSDDERATLVADLDQLSRVVNEAQQHIVRGQRDEA